MLAAASPDRLRLAPSSRTRLKLDDTLAAARYQLGIVLLASSDAAGAEAVLVKGRAAGTSLGFGPHRTRVCLLRWG